MDTYPLLRNMKDRTHLEQVKACLRTCHRIPTRYFSPSSLVGTTKNRTGHGNTMLCCKNQNIVSKSPMSTHLTETVYIPLGDGRMSQYRDNIVVSLKK